MTTQHRTAALLVLLALIAGGIAWANRDVPQPASEASAPVPDTIEQRGKDLKIEAPFTLIEKDAGGTRVQAPGVDVQVPARKPD